MHLPPIKVFSHNILESVQTQEGHQNRRTFWGCVDTSLQDMIPQYNICPVLWDEVPAPFKPYSAPSTAGSKLRIRKHHSTLSPKPFHCQDLCDARTSSCLLLANLAQSALRLGFQPFLAAPILANSHLCSFTRRLLRQQHFLTLCQAGMDSRRSVKVSWVRFKPTPTTPKLAQHGSLSNHYHHPLTRRISP